MSMRFRYHRFATKRPVLTLGGRQDRPHPEVNVTLIGPADTRVVRGLLDTGADDTVFPESWAELIGIDLTGAPAGAFKGTIPGVASVRYAKATMRLAGNGERREWTALVGFTAAPLRRALLGFAGFLQFFSATFHGDREEVELAVNPLYPGI
jgi:predicted aspartyl protease